jgi:zona occludens toxin (predicted ATPase)|tara:strand:- start:24 stop:398 length:375 start_codon:yes stop_codon:yes gene_type:complete
MDGMKVPLAIVMAIALQAGAMLWYVSGIDHRVNTMYIEYQKSNQKAVIENQVRMEMDLQQVVKAVVGMGQQVMMNKEAIGILIEQNSVLIKQNKAIKKQLNTLKKQLNQNKNKKKKKKQDARLS